MNLVIALSLFGALGMISALAYLIRKIGFAGKCIPVTSEWIDDLSLDRYRPMLRMLDGDDIAFLRSQPGFTPDMAKKLRSQRAQIFRGYLRSLEIDFGCVCVAIKLVMLQSRHDRPELAETLLRQQVTFACAMLSVRLHLVLYQPGHLWRGGFKAREDLRFHADRTPHHGPGNRPNGRVNYSRSIRIGSGSWRVQSRFNISFASFQSGNFFSASLNSVVCTHRRALVWSTG